MFLFLFGNQDDVSLKSTYTIYNRLRVAEVTIRKRHDCIRTPGPELQT